MPTQDLKKPETREEFIFKLKEAIEKAVEAGQFIRSKPTVSKTAVE